MAGHELSTEGFKPGQVGSSAMPHKMNSRSCERINGFAHILQGHLTMLMGLVGDQWNEGDVSDSVVRRIALPDSFYAIDGQFQTLLTVLNEFGAYPAVIDRELERYLPFLSTTRILMAAVTAGAGREERQAHGGSEPPGGPDERGTAHGAAILAPPWRRFNRGWPSRRPFAQVGGDPAAPAVAPPGGLRSPGTPVWP